MKLTIVIPTFNRADSLKKTLRSLTFAEIPAGLEIDVIVVDNNSTDNTRETIEELRPLFDRIDLEYCFEPNQGRSYALNTGIKMADGELVSGIDDDEEVDHRWFVEVEKLFRERWDEIDYAAGKLLPHLEVEPPSWVEPLKVGALCWRDFGDEEWVYDKDSPMVTGAHGIFKTSVFRTIGPYHEHLGAKGKGFISGEDEVLFDQLLAAGLRGVYSPKLILYHYVPAYRLKKSYYRKWLLGVGVSRYLADVHYKPFDGSKLLGVPRWMFRSSMAGVLRKIKYIVKRDETLSLEAENQPLIFAGYFFARHVRGKWIDRSAKKIFAGLVNVSNR